MNRWAVIACDQFTSQPEYWRNVKSISENYPSAYNLILPEAELETATQERISQINSSMKNYLDNNIFHEYKNSYVYIERTLLNGDIRKGIVGVIDLNEYDYRTGFSPKIRATEKTVSERIPPRKKVRENAILELSHVILLCDDKQKTLIESFNDKKSLMKKIYDFDLMLDGGNIKGWLIDGKFAEEFDSKMQNYISSKQNSSLTFAVGDGNHSLAAAKACYLENPEKISKYAMVELENIHDDALKFEPIHRIIKNVNPETIIENIKSDLCSQNENDAFELKYYFANKYGTLYLRKNLGASALNIIQKYLDEKNFEIDYIHDIDALKNLSSKSGNLGFELPPFDKKAKFEFFDLIAASGTLPRKTFSMGHAQEKRYYIEARLIRKDF